MNFFIRLVTKKLLKNAASKFFTFVELKHNVCQVTYKNCAPCENPIAL